MKHILIAALFLFLGQAPLFAEEQEEITVSTFYERLTPYGSWTEDPDYGWVFQPKEIEVGWRPYCDNGHWTWTDAGWYWVSDYKWGWACFHYGRWHNKPHRGWVWVPDCTWGPAWVSWRECDTHIGWAALPPGATFTAGVFSFRGHVDIEFGLGAGDFIFVGCNRFLDIHLHRHATPRKQVVNIYNNTTIIKNTYVQNNTTIINNGVSTKVIEKHTGRKIQASKIESVHKPRESQEPGKVNSYRPKVRNEAPVTPKKFQERPDRQRQPERPQRVRPKQPQPQTKHRKADFED